MAWTYTQNFNSLTTADLTGQDSWSGDVDYDVATTATFEGAKAVKAIGANGNIDRAITAVTSGVFYFSMMRPDTVSDATFRLLSGGSVWLGITFESGNIELFDGTGSPTTLVTGYKLNQWYIFEVTIISTSQLSLRYHNGYAWSTTTGTRSSSITGSIDTIRLNAGASGTCYWDNITPTDPTTNQISRDAATNLGSTAGTTLTAAHTCSGSNRILFVHIRAAGTTDTVSSVTYAGVAMTLVNKTFGINNLGTYLYYLIAPSTGSNNVIINTGVAAISAVAVSYNGVLQSGQPDSSTTNSNASTTGLTTSVTSIADNCWTIMGINTGSGNTLPGAGSVAVQEGPNTGVEMFDSGHRITPAGSVSMTFTCDSGAGACVMASFSPSTVTAYTMTADQGAYVLSGQAAAVGRLFTLVANYGSYLLTGLSSALSFTGWSNLAKSSTSTPTNTSKNTATNILNRSKNS